MIERPIPQDIFQYKTKAIGNFSIREAICGALGVAVIGIGVFTYCANIPDPYRAMVAILPALPILGVGFIKLYGVPLEKIILPYLEDNILQPRKRVKQFHYKEQEAFRSRRKWLDYSNPKKTPKIKCKTSKTYRAIK